MLFHSWLQHAMTTSVTFSCFLSCSSSLSFSSFSAPFVSLLQTTHHSSVWIDSQHLVFLFCFSSSFSHAAYQFLSCVIQCHQVLQFWVFKHFSFSLSFWSTSKFSLALASWTSKLLIGLCTQAACSAGVQFAFSFVVPVFSLLLIAWTISLSTCTSVSCVRKKTTSHNRQ